MILFFIFIVISSYFLMQLIEMASFGSRVAGKMSNSLALGTTMQLSVYTASRFLLVPFLPLIGYLIESGLSKEHYLLMVIISIFSTLLASLFVLNRLNFFQLFFQNVFKEYSSSNIPTSLIKSIININKSHVSYISCDSFSFKKIILKKVAVSFVAYSFLVTGFFISFSLAISFPEYRLTFSQFTATFHGIGAVIVAFYLDPMLSRSLDKHSHKDIWLINVYSILYGRVLSYLVSGILFLLVFFIW
jgi:hypothetical protein